MERGINTGYGLFKMSELLAGCFDDYQAQDYSCA
jgi:hypothetical protein